MYMTMYSAFIKHSPSAQPILTAFPSIGFQILYLVEVPVKICADQTKNTPRLPNQFCWGFP